MRKYEAWCWVACAEMLAKTKVTSSVSQISAVNYIVNNYVEDCPCKNNPSLNCACRKNVDLYCICDNSSEQKDYCTCNIPSLGTNYQLFGGDYMDIYFAVQYISNNKIIPSKGAALTEAGVILKLSAKYPIIATLSVTNQEAGHTIMIYHYNDSTGDVKIVEPDIGPPILVLI